VADTRNGPSSARAVDRRRGVVSRFRGLPDIHLGSVDPAQCKSLVRLIVVRAGEDGGDEETRTPDPLLAKEMLCRLSYVPLPRGKCGGRFWTRTRDLCLIRAVL
jgi:hypothetical protein